jgi:hypothetical protein
VLVAIENGVATYDFRVQAPAQPVSGQTGITVAEPLTNTELNGIRQFIVRGAGNSLTVRRRLQADRHHIGAFGRQTNPTSAEF